jgi:hypothetical protein
MSEIETLLEYEYFFPQSFKKMKGIKGKLGCGNLRKTVIES